MPYTDELDIKHTGIQDNQREKMKTTISQTETNTKKKKTDVNVVIQVNDDVEVRDKKTSRKQKWKWKMRKSSDKDIVVEDKPIEEVANRSETQVEVPKKNSLYESQVQRNSEAKLVEKTNKEDGEADTLGKTYVDKHCRKDLSNLLVSTISNYHGHGFTRYIYSVVGSCVKNFTPYLTDVLIKTMLNSRNSD
ncbi:hypothetical protein FQR65_LT09344 [Abscondita terminalis]|nr:hypothetical protein FQR65_LT09344 [Abscondita terminalis]